MSELMALNGANEVLTMSSREIAELTGKRHNHVLRDIRVVLSGLCGGKPSDYGRRNDLLFVTGGRVNCVHYNKDYPNRFEYLVCKDVCDILLSKYLIKWTNHGLMESAALATIEQLQGVKLIRQYPVLNKYHIDGYNPINNIAYEIDEKQHFTPQHINADRIREKQIKAALGCEFVRIRV